MIFTARLNFDGSKLSECRLNATEGKLRISKFYNKGKMKQF